MYLAADEGSYRALAHDAFSRRKRNAFLGTGIGKTETELGAFRLFQRFSVDNMWLRDELSASGDAYHQVENLGLCAAAVMNAMCAGTLGVPALARGRLPLT